MHRFPAALLVAIAALQVSLVYREELSPWKGGGFGMFSTLDGRPHRVVCVRVDARNRSEELVVPPSLERAAAAVEILPTPERLERFGRAIGERERRHGREVERVRVEVWRTGFNRGGLVPVRRRIATHLVRLDR